MNLCKLTTSLIFIILSVSATATKYEFITENNRIETQMCLLIGSNDRSGLVRTLKANSYNSRRIFNSVTCNDMSMAHFAYKYDANLTFSYINRLSNSKNRMELPSVTIRDLSAGVRQDNESTQVIFIRSGH